jgi:hypothetical protein
MHSSEAGRDSDAFKWASGGGSGFVSFNNFLRFACASALLLCGPAWLIPDVSAFQYAGLIAPRPPLGRGCDPFVVPTQRSGHECYDGNPCTHDYLQDCVCRHDPISGTLCHIDPVTCRRDYCVDGGCPPGPPAYPCDELDDICNDYRCEYIFIKGGGSYYGCVPHPYQDPCEDGNICTNDHCYDGMCHNIPNSLPCEDDGNPCTGDECEDGYCAHPPGGGSCSDSNACTINDHCDGGGCVGTPINCEDGNLCTWDWCDSVWGCRHEGGAGPCDDGNPCTVGDVCGPSGCQGTPMDCTDSDPCTPDLCVDGECVPGHPDCESAEDPCNANPVINSYAVCENCTITLTAPETIPLNCDDDNNNDLPDAMEIGPIPEEDDLRPLYVEMTGDCPGMGGKPEDVIWRLAEGSGNRTWRAYRNPDKTGPVDSLVGGYQDWPVPPTLWLEGIAPTIDCPTRVVLWLGQGYGGGGACIYCGYEANRPEVAVCLGERGQRQKRRSPSTRGGSGCVAVRLEWQPPDPGNAPLGTCPNNAGVTIFPDKVSPTDSNPTIRRQVDLVASVVPALPGVTVYFKVFDVDDPFDQLNVAMPDVGLVDANTSGPDNRPAGESIQLFTRTTGSDGKATVTLTVSMQPGNNYRAAAATTLTDIDLATQEKADSLSAYFESPTGTWHKNGDFNGYFPCQTVWSPMLTVWRKLHVEVDSMAAPDSGNTQSGTVQGSPSYNGANNRAIIDIADLDPDDWEVPDQHKVGRIDISGFGSFTTIATIPSAFADQVEIISAPPTIVNANGATYTLWDDDAGSVPPFVMVGFDAPPVTLPKVPDTGLMAQVFKDAYVYVPPPDMQYYDANSPFDRNVADGEEVERGNENRDLTSATDFWVVHVTAAFQGFTAKDGDPDNEQATPGLQYGITGVPTLAWWRRAGSLIYLETIRDDKRGNQVNMTTLERYTVTHEAGHQFKLEHGDDYAPPAGPEGDYIMTNITDQTGMAPNVAFSPTSLKKIREIDFPPQP